MTSHTSLPGFTGLTRFSRCIHSPGRYAASHAASTIRAKHAHVVVKAMRDAMQSNSSEMDVSVERLTMHKEPLTVKEKCGAVHTVHDTVPAEHRKSMMILAPDELTHLVTMASHVDASTLRISPLAVVHAQERDVDESEVVLDDAEEIEVDVQHPPTALRRTTKKNLITKDEKKQKNAPPPCTHTEPVTDDRRHGGSQSERDETTTTGALKKRKKKTKNAPAPPRKPKKAPTAVAVLLASSTGELAPTSPASTTSTAKKEMVKVTKVTTTSTKTTTTTTKNNRNNNSISNISNGASSKKRVVDEIITITNKSKLTQKEQIRKRLWAGTMSTICVRTLLAPLERLKTEYLFNRSKDALFQTAKIVFKNEGVIGFWKGNFVNICRTAPFKAINFSAFDTYRTAIKKTFDVKENTALDEISLLISGAFACGTAVTICYPMDVVRTRLVVKGGKEKYKNIVSCVRILYREEGLASFYRGILPAMAQMTPNAAVYYSVYNSLKQYRLTEMKKEADEIKTQRLMRTTPSDSNTKLKNNEKKLSVAAAAKSSTTKEENDLVPRTIEPQFMMLFGMLAGVASESFTFPLEVARRQIQMNTGRVCAKDILGSKEMKMMLEVTRKVLKENGFAGLYKGLTPTIMQVLPSAAMGYYCYESFKLVAGVD